MKVSCRLWVLCGALLVQGVGHSRPADAGRATMNVSVMVAGHASVEALGSAAHVSVTAADLERGYLDVTRAYRLRSNTARGLLLQFNPRVGLTRQIDITGLESPVQITDMNVEILQPANDRLQLQFRLWLHPDAMPGNYPLPVALAALPI